MIGKLRLQIKFNKCFLNQSSNDENLLIEKQLVYNRKIPKNACLSLNLNYFKYETPFLHLLDMMNNCYFLSLDPFGEDKNLKKVNFELKIEFSSEMLKNEVQLTKWGVRSKI